jgi:hypothetical protein
MSDAGDSAGCEFVFSFPVWTVAKQGAPDVPAGGHLPGGVKFIVMFTDEDLADRFITATGRETDGLATSVDDPVTFLGMLDLWHKDGYTHLVLDPSGRPAHERLVSIDRLMVDLAKGNQ